MIFLEGGGQDSKEQHVRCREGFRRLFLKCGYSGRMPRTIASGGRDAAYDDFRTAHAHNRAGDYVVLLVDSEEPVANVEETWKHLATRDRWDKPDGAYDEQVLLMTTCMETWIATDHDALRRHYSADLEESALPPVMNMESRDRHDIQNRLEHATRNCANRFKKGTRSFAVLAELEPATLEANLPSFKRIRRILDQRL